MEAKALIFDCDGTLVDSMPMHYRAWADTMARYGIEFTEKLFYELGGWAAYRIVKLLADENGKTLDAVAIADEKDLEFMRNTHHVAVNEPVVAIARQYHGIKPLAVASGSARRLVEKELTELGLIGLFDAIVCEEDVEHHKPAPDVFLSAAKLLKVEPQDCCVYEDSDAGIAAAKTAGMQYVDVRTMMR